MDYKTLLKELNNMHTVIQENLCYGVCSECASFKDNMCRVSKINNAIYELERELKKEMEEEKCK